MKDKFNLTEFASLIGVSPVTLMNWDSNGKLVPETRMGKTRLYSLEQYCEYQISKLMNANVNSFLGILVNREEEGLLKDEKVFALTINSQIPKASYVEDIKGQIIKFIETDSVDTSSATYQEMLKDKVLTEYYHASQIELGKAIAEQVYAHKELKKIPYGCFVKMACGVPLDESTLANVQSVCATAGTTYNILAQTLSVAYQETKRQYGVISIISESGISDYDIFNGKKINLSQVASINVDTSTGSTKANKLAKELQSKAHSKGTSKAIAEVFKNGYYTTRKFNITDTMTEEDKLKIFQEVNAGYYKTVYVSHWEYLSSTLQVLLNDLNMRGKIILVTPSETNVQAIENND